MYGSKMKKEMALTQHSLSIFQSVAILAPVSTPLPASLGLWIVLVLFGHWWSEAQIVTEISMNC